jgi:hypothetical protein
MAASGGHCRNSPGNGTVFVRGAGDGQSPVLQRLFLGLQQEQMIAVKIEILAVDLTPVKVHPGAHGALKNRETIHR